jgi:Amt family ammonium transporter
MIDSLTWVLLAGMLVLLMQGGFALVNSGLCRAKNAGQVVAMNFMIAPLSILGFWVCGFALMFGSGHESALSAAQWTLGAGPLDPAKSWGPETFGHRGFFLGSFGLDPMVLRLFFFESAVIAVAAAIPTGVMAERWRFPNFILYGLCAGALPIAIFGHWVWGGGWLSQLGQYFGLGHGFVDFAGSSVVHMVGGVLGLAGASMVGPRLGKYSRDGRPRPMPGHNLVNVVVGTVVLAFGWFGLNLGPALAAAPERVTLIAINTLLASATGTLGAYAIVMMKFRKPDPSMLCNGMLAGLAAISGSCAFVSTGGAVIIGTVAGVLVVYSVLFFEGKVRVDDPVGAISVHGIGGAWGVLSIGLLANGSFGAGWNGIHTAVKNGSETGVTGALGMLFGAPTNDWSQLGAQAVGALACLIFTGIFAYVWFKISNLVVPMRSRREEEIAGLDLPEMGAECYPDFHLTDTGSSHNE